MSHRARSSIAAICAALGLLSACGKKPDAHRTDDDHDDHGTHRSKSDDSRFSIDVTDATIDETLTAYRRATGNDLGMRDTVRKHVDCVKVTFSVARDSAADVERALGDKLGDFGLKIEERTGLHTVTRDYAKPAPCPSTGEDTDTLDPFTARPRRIPPPVPLELSGSTVAPLGAPVAGVEKVSDTQFKIERTTFDTLKFDTRAVRIVPNQKDGKPDGIKIFGLRYDSILTALGLRNGDIVHSVNGYDLSDPSKALDAYSKLKGAKQLVVVIERRGTPMTITIDVVPDGTVGKPVSRDPIVLP